MLYLLGASRGEIQMCGIWCRKVNKYFAASFINSSNNVNNNTLVLLTEMRIKSMSSYHVSNDI